MIKWLRCPHVSQRGSRRETEDETDFRYVIPFIVQFGLYVSPVGFELSPNFGDGRGQAAAA